MKIEFETFNELSVVQGHGYRFGTGDEFHSQTGYNCDHAFCVWRDVKSHNNYLPSDVHFSDDNPHNAIRFAYRWLEHVDRLEDPYKDVDPLELGREIREAMDWDTDSVRTRGSQVLAQLRRYGRAAEDMLIAITGSSMETLLARMDPRVVLEEGALWEEFGREIHRAVSEDPTGYEEMGQGIHTVLEDIPLERAKAIFKAFTGRDLATVVKDIRDDND